MAGIVNSTAAPNDGAARGLPAFGTGEDAGDEVDGVPRDRPEPHCVPAVSLISVPRLRFVLRMRGEPGGGSARAEI
jgi:hypothetical protein